MMDISYDLLHGNKRMSISVEGYTSLESAKEAAMNLYKLNKDKLDINGVPRFSERSFTRNEKIDDNTFVQQQFYLLVVE